MLIRARSRCRRMRSTIVRGKSWSRGFRWGGLFLSKRYVNWYKPKQPTTWNHRGRHVVLKSLRFWHSRIRNKCIALINLKVMSFMFHLIHFQTSFQWNMNFEASLNYRRMFSLISHPKFKKDTSHSLNACPRTSVLPFMLTLQFWFWTHYWKNV